MSPREKSELQCLVKLLGVNETPPTVTTQIDLEGIAGTLAPELTHRSISPEANGAKNILFQKLFLFINIVSLKSDTISKTSF